MRTGQRTGHGARLLILIGFLGVGQIAAAEQELTYPIVDTAQIRCYDDRTEVPFPKAGSTYFGQDAHYKGNEPQYKDNGDGTVTDLVTGLMWQNDPGSKLPLAQADTKARACRTGGHRDWRVPTIKELYSLIIFSGTDPDPRSRDTSNLKPFIDTRYFNFKYGNAQSGERIIDSQYGSSTRYVSTTMRADQTMFGVNFADGRIKGYGVNSPRTGKENAFYFIFVRGNPAYGENHLVDNGDGTLTDRATGLTWMQVDSGALEAGPEKDGKMNWAQALAWAEGLTYAGKSDWRVPNIKELHSIVDYARSPKTTQSAAIDKHFDVTPLIDEAGKQNFPFYWSSSSHNSPTGSQAADYMAFGEALGWMEDLRTGKRTLLDVHGAGAQRSDPKSGAPSQFPYGRGPQGDVIRINNFVLCVRGGEAAARTRGPEVEPQRASGSRQPSGGASRFVERLDRNGDSKVSPDEFDGPSRRFGRLDTDGDGYISEDEAPKGPPRGR